MDAKPIRPLRLTRVHDENAVPAPAAASKIVHQRHKSVPALSNLMQFGAMKNLAQKRAAFADVSNHRGGQVAKDDSGINDAVKSKANAGVKVAELNAKENILARKPQRGATVKVANPAPSQTLPTSNSASQLLSAPPSKPTGQEHVTKKNIQILQDAHTRSDRATTEAQLDDALRYAIGNAPLPSQRAHDVAPLQHPAHVLPSHPQISLPHIPSSAHLPPHSAYPDTNEQAQAALQAVLRQEHLQQHHSKAVPLRSQDYYESDYDTTSYQGDHNARKSLGMGSDTTGGVTIVLAPKYTARIRQEIAAAKDFVEANRTPEDIEDDHWDTSMVAEYGDEIFDYMGKLEERMRPNPHYMDHQTECQWSMRAVLLDWLVQVHARFSLLPETLFLSVNYIDRFLSAKIVSLAKLQLVGATALFLAAKYEEVNCPSILEIVYMVDNGYTVEEILKAERFMLSMLAFELGWPGPMSFLRRISKADDYDLETRTLAKYFLEITIMDERFLSCPPSSTAAAAHCLARLMLRKGDWTQAHVYYSNYTYDQLRPILRVIVECCENPVQHHAAVYAKYQDKRYKKSSLYVQQEMQAGFVLPPVQNRNSSFGMTDLSISQGWRDLD